MNRPVSMSRIDFVRSRINSLRMDVTSVYGKDPGPELEIFESIHDALTELTDEVQSLREDVRFHKGDHHGQ